jgi:uncharacterized protein
MERGEKIMPYKGESSMRRKQFEVRDGKLIEEVLNSAEIGYLAFNGLDGWPRITPLNFVYNGRILWHGAVAGERFDCLQKNPRATFTAVSIYRYIPSHFTSEENATGASMAFKSVQLRGRCVSVVDPEEKCAILNQLMDKYQPEGRFQRVSPDAPLYKKILQATGVYALQAEEVVGKFKLAQNKNEADRGKIIARLKESGSAIDLLMAAEISKTL